MAKSVYIVIPFCQRQAGALRRTLQSVFCQKNAPTFQIIIIDDGSPLTAESELGDLVPGDRERVTVLRQKNKGVGSARNAGLDAVPEDAEWVALLDSDDLWEEWHLSQAVAVLSQGFDLYFADGGLEGKPGSLFDGSRFRPENHERIPDQEQCYEYVGDLLGATLRGPLFPTSTVVFRRSKLGSLRFPAWRGTCEDLRYWLDVAGTAPRTGFSARVAVNDVVDGVHTSHIAEWKSNKSLRVLSDRMKYYSEVVEHVTLPAELHDLARQRLATSRKDFLVTALAMGKAGKIPEPYILWSFARHFPMAILDTIRGLHALSRKAQA